ncbi:elongation factor G [Desulfovibrio sp. OttesenSCG-928-A18]|nr:elongation factor G [Desulfovibrio sp. OttesenSCG-928-A18]
MSNDIHAQRTYALVGTSGCGKTTLAEMLLLETGVITRLGKIEEGNTALDYEPEEIKRRGSIQPAFATFTRGAARHFLVDLPGDGNFVGDIDMLLAGIDSALFVIDAVDGVRPLTKRLWSSVQNAYLPAMCAITKLDRDRSDFYAAYAGLSSILGIRTVLLYAPIGEQSAFKGVVDVLGGKALNFNADGSVSEGEIPADMADEMATLRETAVENIAECDDSLMEKYLEEGELSEEEIRTGLRKGVLDRMLVPVVALSGLENKGAKPLLSAVEALLPSGLDRAPFAGVDGKELIPSESGPAACFVCKTLTDPFAGQLTVIRVLSGSISGDSTLKNMSTGDNERLGAPILMNGKTQNQTKDSMGPGAIVALAKLKNTRTGATLSDEKLAFTLQAPQLPPQLISYALAPKEKGDEDKVFAAVQRLLDEDITLKLNRDEETGDILVSGMGQLHIETAVERARRRYKVDILLKTPKVPYRETIRGTAQVQGRHKKQSGGRGQFGDCWVEFAPLERGSGYQFEDAIVGGVVPRQYIPAVDKGVQEASARGFLAGYPMVDFKAKLYDGSYHTVDSSEMAFKVAGSLAFKKAMESCKPTLLEPIVTLTISIPDENMGDVIGDLSSRRGKVSGSDSVAGITEIKAQVPMNEVLRYAPDLRSMTGGQGSFTMEFSHYEEAPQPVTEKVVAEYKAAKEAE